MAPSSQQPQPVHPLADHYVEHGRFVFTAAFLLRRGTCCDNGCRHCPYQGEPSALAAGSPTIDATTIVPTPIS